MTSSEEFKELGSKAYRENDFSKAISEWSNAINGSNSDKNFLKVVYSNRSAAYHKLKQYTPALSDAEKCVSLDSTWSKGYTRKGDALYALYRYTEAFNAYNSGLRVAPADEKQALQIKAEQAMRAIRSQDESSANNSSSSSSSTSAGGPYSQYLRPLQRYLRICIFISLFCYMIPVSRSLNSMSARFFSISTILVKALSIYDKFGMIKFNMDYAGRVLSDASGMGLFLGVLLLTSGKPYFLALASVAIAELTHFTQDIGLYGRANLPMLQAQLGPMLGRYGQSLLRGADPGQVLAELFSPRSVNMINTQFLNGSAYCEVLQGVYLVFELLLPSRNFMFLALWWQYLQMRFMMDRSGEIKTAFRTFDQQLLGLLNNKLCPPLVLSLYNQLKAYLAKRVEPPQAGEGGGGGGIGSALSSCNIM